MLFHKVRDSTQNRVIDEGFHDDVKHEENPENRHEKACHKEENDAEIE